MVLQTLNDLKDVNKKELKKLAIKWIKKWRDEEIKKGEQSAKEYMEMDYPSKANGAIGISRRKSKEKGKELMLFLNITEEDLR